MPVWVRKIRIQNPERMQEKGPLLLACNHPNSALDGIVLDTLFDFPLHSLARGDAFKKPFVNKFLHKINLLPVYRTSEGVENLGHNYATFEACKKIFEQHGSVIIFSEGKCINEWHLRPLKKGTARLAISSWDQNIPLRVLPVGLNYSSFNHFGKNIILTFGTLIEKHHIPSSDTSDGARNLAFNALLEAQLRSMVYEIPKEDKVQQAEKLGIKVQLWQKILLAPFALAGVILHAPIYLPLKKLARSKAGHTDHYDSVLNGLLLLLYPVYLILFALIAGLISHTWYALALILILPLTARAAVQLNQQTG